MKKSSKFKNLAFASGLILASLIPTTIPAASASAASDTTHYLSFASDLHGLNDRIESSMGGMTKNVEYVSLIGDLVGERGGDHPAFNSSDILSLINNVFSTADKTNTSIIWADHDASVNDDADIVKSLNGHSSSEIYEGSKDADGYPSYYIYSVGFYNLTAGGDESKAAAEDFKAWVEDKDPSIPVIVLCHVPLVAKRGDNFGALYWTEALNYAATGIENIVDTDTTAEVTRNVFYFYGHNHTVDATEYYYAPGDQMNVQIDQSGNFSETNLLSAGKSLKNITATDEELGSVTATGIDVNIYFNSLITGYLKTSGNATLMSISSDAITLTKYNGSNTVSLGTNGYTGETVGSSVKIARIARETTPEDDIPAVPDSGSFENSPELISETTSVASFLIFTSLAIFFVIKKKQA